MKKFAIAIIYIANALCFRFMLELNTVNDIVIMRRLKVLRILDRIVTRLIYYFERW